MSDNDQSGHRNAISTFEFLGIKSIDDIFESSSNDDDVVEIKSNSSTSTIEYDVEAECEKYKASINFNNVGDD
jgi:hypothetical protein